MWQNRFQTILADTHDSRRLHYNLRYKVFCEETGFEDARFFPEEEEMDGYDQAAVHFLVWDDLQQEWAGTMRLIDGRQSDLPSESLCKAPLLDIEAKRSKAVEFSRLCITEGYRQLQRDIRFGLRPVKAFPGQIQRPVIYRHEKNEILLRMIRAMFAWTRENRIEYCYFLINTILARALKWMHIRLTEAGDKIEHRGRRRPFVCDTRENEQRMLDALPAFDRLAKNSRAFVPYSAFIRGQRQPKMVPALPQPPRNRLGIEV